MKCVFQYPKPALSHVNNETLDDTRFINKGVNDILESILAT